MRALVDAVSRNQQEVMAVKTHWDCDKPVLSFALAEGGVRVNSRLKRDRATAATRLMILVDSWLFTRDTSEGIET